MSYDLCVDMSHFTGMNGCVQCDLVGHPCCTAGETPNMKLTGRAHAMNFLTVNEQREVYHMPKAFK